MNDPKLIGPWVRRFLLEFMIGERNLSRSTQASYRDTLTLLIPFVSMATNKPIHKLIIDDFSSPVIRQFLEHLETNRTCCVSTRNQRLAAIHSWAGFIGIRHPEYLAWWTEIKSIPFKKAPKPAIPYLEKPEMDALLAAPDRKTAQGLRDYALLLYLYNTGARADEAARLVVEDLTFGNSPSVRIIGKGNKIRFCPLWTITADVLQRLFTERVALQALFLNRQQQPVTRFGIYALVKRYALKASKKVPTIQTKRVSPHTIRHTAAVHLLRAGVDINTIRAWLGHVSLDTTHIYAEIDLEMKAKALSHCEISEKAEWKVWRKEPELMAFLKSL